MPPQIDMGELPEDAHQMTLTGAVLVPIREERVVMALDTNSW